MKKFSYRLFKQGGELLLAISDSSIVGKKFNDNGLQLIIDENFYSEKLCDEDEATQLIKSATIVNAVGKEIIGMMLKKKFVEEDNILYVSKTPHAQVVIV
ncbi:MAG: DUF424 family protein [Candidatus Aenigmatarchaeota archaeon]